MIASGVVKNLYSPSSRYIVKLGIRRLVAAGETDLKSEKVRPVTPVTCELKLQHCTTSPGQYDTMMCITARNRS
jgi:hypothetical protein